MIKIEEVLIMNNRAFVVEGIKVSGDSIVVKSGYNPDVVAAVKASDNRKYNADDKTWEVSNRDVFGLVGRLKGIPNVVLSGALADEEFVSSLAPKTAEIRLLLDMKRKPFKHQIAAAKMLLRVKKAILADEMGVGKTMTAIIAAYKVVGKKLIVCPAGLKLNWEKEILMVDENAEIEVVEGKSKKMFDKEWTVINYDILGKNKDIIKAAGFSVLIFDEAHYLKSVDNSGRPTAGRGKNAMEIAEDVEYVFALTGTPITNKTKDIFNLLKMVKHPVSKKWMDFALRYCDATKDRFGWDMNGSSNREELNRVLKSVMIRRLKEDVVDLPDKIRSFIPCKINTRKYDALVKEYVSNSRKNSGDKSKWDKGEQLVLLNGMRKVLAVEKVPFSIEQIDNMVEQCKPVVLFTCYREVVDKIVEEFPQALKITGDCSKEEKQRAVDRFQSGTDKIMVCNITAGGVGITLTESDTVIFNDFDWTPANHVQAEDRIHRIGQINKCNILYLFAKNADMDNRMAEILEDKLANAAKIVDGKDDSMFGDIANMF